MHIRLKIYLHLNAFASIVLSQPWPLVTMVEAVEIWQTASNIEDEYSLRKTRGISL